MLLRLTPLLVLVLASCTSHSARPSQPAPELKGLQGRWECSLGEDHPRGVTRAVKHVTGNSETVTYYDKAGKVVYATAADFDVEARGTVRLFTYWNLRLTQGGDNAPKPAEGRRSYIFRVDGDA